ncbi:Protein FAR-RED ELONGATED HYPOCOTYL 3 [Bienertia sinuspersici]
MVFLTLDDLDNFFRRYAKQQGFGIMKAGGAYKQEKGKIVSERRNCTWKCESGGKPDARIRASTRLLNGVSAKGVKMANRKTKKVGCPVMLHAKVTNDGKWQIRNIHSALAAERNGVENFPVSERQLRNVVDKEKRLKMMEGDANAIAAYFHRMSLYQEREWWIPPYMKDMFWAGMRSTQRVESMNSFFDKYLKKQTRLYEFVQQYCKAMERRAEDEKQADAESARFCHQLVSDFPIERVFQKIYTSAKFVEVQQECMKNLYVSIVGCKVVDENVLEYTIENRVWVRDPNTRKEVPTRRKREYEVKYNSNSYEAWCVCKLMESSGIICRHIIAVFEKNDVEEMIPESSIPPPLTRTTHSTFVLLGNDWTTPLSSAESSKDEFDSWKELLELLMFGTKTYIVNTRSVNIHVNGVLLLPKVNANAGEDGLGVLDKLVKVVLVVLVLFFAYKAFGVV